MRIKLAVVALVALVVPVLSVAPAQAAAGPITGTVTGPGGTPLAGIPIDVYDVIQDGSDPLDQFLVGTTTTDGSGHYSITPDWSDVVVCFQSPDYVQECYGGGYINLGSENGRYGTSVNGQGASGIDASLIVGASISGDVSTTDTGVPVTTALVTALIDLGSNEIPHAYNGYTDQSGHYTIAHIEPGTAVVCAESPKMLRHCTAAEGGPNQYALEDGDVVTGVDFHFTTRPQHVRVNSTGSGRIQFAWDKIPGATNYRVSLFSSPTLKNPVLKYPDGNWITLTGLTPGHRYYIGVRGQSMYGLTNVSDIVSGRAGVVEGVRALTSAAALTVEWLPFTGAKKYQVEISSGPTFAGFRSVVVTGPQAVVGGLVGGSTYYARVRPLTTAGTPLAGWSSVAHGIAGEAP